MNIIKEISNKTVSISQFNRGLAGRIFEDVKADGYKIVLKNNLPECVLLSPDEYENLIQELEDARDIILAKERLENLKAEDMVTQEEFEKMHGIKFDEIEPLDEDEFEWVIS